MTKDVSIARTLRRRLIEAGVPLRRAWLFGSRARRTHGPDSDLDVCLVLDRLDDNLERRISAIAWEVGFEAGRIIMTVEYTEDQITRSPVRASPFLRAVIEEGIPV